MTANQTNASDEIVALTETFVEELHSAVEVRFQNLRTAALHAISKAAEDTRSVKDAALQRARPVCVVPKFDELEPLAHGERILVAEDGLWLEVVRPWLHAVQPIAPKVAAVALPYGTVQKKLTLGFGKIPANYIHGFVLEAIKALPNEHAQAIKWVERDGMLCAESLETESASPGHIKFKRPRIEAGESLAIDLHSHGGADAFFSSTDDQDDFGDVKVAGVIGNLGKGMPTCCFRLCAAGLYVPLASGPVDQVFKNWKDFE